VNKHSITPKYLKANWFFITFSILTVIFTNMSQSIEFNNDWISDFTIWMNNIILTMLIYQIMTFLTKLIVDRNFVNLIGLFLSLFLTQTFKFTYETNNLSPFYIFLSITSAVLLIFSSSMLGVDIGKKKARKIHEDYISQLDNYPVLDKKDMIKHINHALRIAKSYSFVYYLIQENSVDSLLILKKDINESIKRNKK
jgi:hypothetical protein